MDWQALFGMDDDVDSGFVGNLPPGPMTLTDSHAWASDCLSRLSARFGDQVANFLQGNLDHGIYITSHYSGWGTEFAAKPYIMRAASDAGLKVDDTVGLVHWGACDISETCRWVLANHKSSTRPQHVFADVMDYLPATRRCALTHVLENYQDLVAVAEGEHDPASAVADLNQACLREYFGVLEPVKFHKSMKAWCSIHSKFCHVFPQRRHISSRALHIEVAGTTCTAHCAIGSHAKWMDPSVLPCLEWLFMMMAISPDVCVHENSPMFPHEHSAKDAAEDEDPICGVFSSRPWSALPEGQTLHEV